MTPRSKPPPPPRALGTAASPPATQPERGETPADARREEGGRFRRASSPRTRRSPCDGCGVARLPSAALITGDPRAVSCIALAVSPPLPPPPGFGRRSKRADGAGGAAAARRRAEKAIFSRYIFYKSNILCVSAFAWKSVSGLSAGARDSAWDRAGSRCPCAPPAANPTHPALGEHGTEPAPLPGAVPHHQQFAGGRGTPPPPRAVPQLCVHLGFKQTL